MSNPEDYLDCEDAERWWLHSGRVDRLAPAGLRRKYHHVRHGGTLREGEIEQILARAIEAHEALREMLILLRAAERERDEARARAERAEAGLDTLWTPEEAEWSCQESTGPYHAPTAVMRSERLGCVTVEVHGCELTLDVSGLDLDLDHAGMCRVAERLAPAALAAIERATTDPEQRGES